MPSLLTYTSYSTFTAIVFPAISKTLVRKLCCPVMLFVRFSQVPLARALILRGDYLVQLAERLLIRKEDAELSCQNLVL
jgi:hypothetical protein